MPFPARHLLFLLLPLAAVGCSWFNRFPKVQRVATEDLAPAEVEEPTLLERLEGSRAANNAATSQTTTTADTRFANPQRLGDGARLGVGRAFDPIYFDDDRTELSSPNRRQLDEYAAWLGEHPRVWVTLVGHGDLENTVPWAYQEGMARAIVVREYLIARGLNGRRFYPLSYGLDRPEVLGGGAEANARNNRVELIAFMAPEGVDLPAEESTAPETAPREESPAEAPPTEELR